MSQQPARTGVEEARALEREAQLERALLSLRDPLARIELAASQWLRDESRRLARSLAESISEAVADLDVRIGEALRVLRGRARVGAEGDGEAALRGLVSELEPVFRARSRRLELELPARPVRLDSRTARRAALRLLRGAGAWVGGGGRLSLVLLDERERWGLRVDAERASTGTELVGSGRSDESADAVGALPELGSSLRDAQSFAAAEGGSLDCPRVAADARQGRATLWFPHAAPVTPLAGAVT